MGGGIYRLGRGCNRDADGCGFGDDYSVGGGHRDISEILDRNERGALYGVYGRGDDRYVRADTRAASLGGLAGPGGAVCLRDSFDRDAWDGGGGVYPQPYTEYRCEDLRVVRGVFRGGGGVVGGIQRVKNRDEYVRAHRRAGGLVYCGARAAGIFGIFAGSDVQDAWGPIVGERHRGGFGEPVGRDTAFVRLGGGGLCQPGVVHVLGIGGRLWSGGGQGVREGGGRSQIAEYDSGDGDKDKGLVPGAVCGFVSGYGDWDFGDGGISCSRGGYPRG